MVVVFVFNSNSVRETFLAGMEQCVGNEGGLPFPYSVFVGFSVVGIGNQ